MFLKITFGNRCVDHDPVYVAYVKNQEIAVRAAEKLLVEALAAKRAIMLDEVSVKRVETVAEVPRPSVVLFVEDTGPVVDAKEEWHLDARPPLS